MSKLRAFLAIPLSEDFRRQAAHLQKELAPSLPDLRWVRPETLHLTLRFLPDLPEETVEKIGQIMLSVGAVFPPFDIGITNLGTFPGPSRARVLWLGIDVGEILAKLFRALDKGLETLGIPRETRPFTPHLTLGRWRQPGAFPEDLRQRLAAGSIGGFRAEQLILFESRLAANGATHLPLRVVTLGLPRAATS
ncbi:RNA 2',3'-cyclic phosphodiesterase [Trichloromonas sp.]|uniref:RNA 2',3'-cyclic phosphodiesterase n=1 Tax=Trichloromonas sp. TaxID=3069249 RepID=UPI002A385D9C|nr:RNA 2',3'-cyclic phosphodiesterase [Trichloromonas sp.]